MQPYINPLFFYLAKVADSLDVALTFLTGALFVGFVMLLLGTFCSIEEGDEEEMAKRCKKGAIIFGVLFVFFGFLAILIPNQQTCYEMLIASVITPNNVNQAKEIITEIIKAAGAMVGGGH